MSNIMLQDIIETGARVRFAYGLPADPSSEISERLAHRSGQMVEVLGFEPNDAEEGSTAEERADAGTPVTYAVRFPDGHTDTAFEDELEG